WANTSSMALGPPVDEPITTTLLAAPVGAGGRVGRGRLGAAAGTLLGAGSWARAAQRILSTSSWAMLWRSTAPGPAGLETKSTAPRAQAWMVVSEPWRVRLQRITTGSGLSAMIRFSVSRPP